MMKSLTILFLALFVFSGSLAHAQVEQTSLSLYTGAGTFLTITGASGGRTFQFPTGTGTLLTTATGLSNPMNALGALIYGGASGVPTQLAGNASGSTKTFLTSTASGGVATAPAWGTIAAADVPVFVASGASHAAGAVPDPGLTAGT